MRGETVRMFQATAPASRTYLRCVPAAAGTAIGDTRGVPAITGAPPDRLPPAGLTTDCALVALSCAASARRSREED